MAERSRGPHLEQLLERAEPAGQHEERLGAPIHLGLAGAHVRGDDQLVGLEVGDLAQPQRVRDHTDGPRTAGPGRRGRPRPCTTPSRRR